MQINFDKMKVSIDLILRQGILDPEKCTIPTKIRAKYQKSQYVPLLELFNLCNDYDRACFYAVLPESLRRYLPAGFVAYFISKGWDIHAEDDAALRLVCLHGDLELAQCLVENGANVNAKNGLAVWGCVHSEKLDILRFLLVSGADPNLSHGLAIECAIRDEKEEFFRTLLQYGGEVVDHRKFLLDKASPAMKSIYNKFITDKE